MATWRTLAILVVALSTAATTRAQTYTLKEAPLQDKSFHVQLTMRMVGQLQIHQEDKSLQLKQSAEAKHDFLERVCDADDSGTLRKTARFYNEAKAVIQVGDGDKSTRTFRPDHRFLVAQRYQQQPLTFCPDHPLTREELELTEHFDTLSLPGLLPGKTVAVGETWKLSNASAQGLCDFDGLTANDLVCKLDAVKDDVAVFTVSGTANGIDTGAAVKLEVRACGKFDLKAQRITALEWEQRESREEGPASPALSAETVFNLQRAEIEEPTELNQEFVGGVVSREQQTPPDSWTELVYADPKGRYEMKYNRDWLMVARAEQYLVLRLLDSGDFVAQATLTPWKKADKGQHLSKEEFKEAMSSSPGWEMEEIVAEEVLAHPGTKEEVKEIKESPEQGKGYCIYRLAALGELNGLRAMQYFYLIAGPEGDQLVIAFTLTPAQAQKLGDRDLALVRNITFSPPREGSQLLKTAEPKTGS